MSQSKVTAGPEARVTVAVVTALEEAGGTGDATLRLADGSTLKVAHGSPLFGFLSDWTKKKKAKPLYIESDPAGQVKLVLPSALRRIERVAAEPQGDRLGVEILMSPSRHFLSTRGVHYPEMRQLLQQAVAGKEPVLLTVQPDTMEILDARRPPAGLDLPVI